MKKGFLLLIILAHLSCNFISEESVVADQSLLLDTILSTKEDYTQSEFYIQERLPNWLLETAILDGLVIKEAYQLDNRLNPLYLEADFNGDGQLDIALPIQHHSSQKVGFAIIHRKSLDIHILGAGIPIKNGLADDMNFIDVWKVNRQEINEAGAEETTGTGEKGALLLTHPSLQIEKSEVGGGLLYWNGKEYAYFHQSC